jgi:HlyD family secretion protein
MKKGKLLFFTLILIFILAGCKSSDLKEDEEISKKPVKIIEVKEESAISEFQYIGIVTPEEVKKLSFKSSGKIASIKIEEGQKVKKGQTLAILDTKDIGYSVNAAKAAKDAAQAQYNKAVKGATEEEIDIALSNAAKTEKAYEFSKESYERAQKLYEAGGLSKAELDKAKLELDIRLEEYNGAMTILSQTQKGSRDEDKEILKAQVNQADTDLSYKLSMVNDANMKADMDGYIMNVLSKDGEIISAGYPIIILGSSVNIVKFGLTPEDVAQINIGDSIRVESLDKTFYGKIKSIEKIMDSETRTYSTKAILEDCYLSSGTIVRIYIPTDEYVAVNIPLTSIMRGNYDYVYIVLDNKAKKKQIELGKVKGDLVEVSGLMAGEKLVVEGMKKINDGDVVEVTK